MHHDLPVLRELLLLAGVSLFVILLFQRLRLPALTGFIVTGVLIGPRGFALVRDPELVRTMSEIGVVLNFEARGTGEHLNAFDGPTASAPASNGISLRGDALRDETSDHAESHHADRPIPRQVFFARLPDRGALLREIISHASLEMQHGVERVFRHRPRQSRVHQPDHRHIGR